MIRPALNQLRHWARGIKRQIMVLWFSCRNPKTPLLPKLLALCVVGYALSPIDLIPDFIPVLGLLDDAILLPLGILLVMRFIPQNVLDISRARALDWERNREPKPVSKVAAVFIIILWSAALLALWKYLA